MLGRGGQRQSQPALNSQRHHSRGHGNTMPGATDTAHASGRDQAMKMEKDPREEEQGEAVSPYPRRTTAYYGHLPPDQLGQWYPTEVAGDWLYL